MFCRIYCDKTEGTGKLWSSGSGIGISSRNLGGAHREITKRLTMIRGKSTSSRRVWRTRSASGYNKNIHRRYRVSGTQRNMYKEMSILNTCINNTQPDLISSGSYLVILSLADSEATCDSSLVPDLIFGTWFNVWYLGNWNSCVLSITNTRYE